MSKGDWVVDRISGCYFLSQDGEPLNVHCESESTARRIVTAVNAFEPLVKVVRELIDSYEFGKEPAPLQDKARAALALAEKGTKP